MCTLWGNFADTMYAACENVADTVVTCLIRFAKINNSSIFFFYIYTLTSLTRLIYVKYATIGVRSIASAFNVSQLLINSEDTKEITEFVNW